MTAILLDQNVPGLAKAWLLSRHPEWLVLHASDPGLQTASDDEIAERAIELDAVIVTFDEDFLDARTPERVRATGLIRLRVWPTHWPMIEDAVSQLLNEVPPEQFRGNAVTVDRARIRVRPL